MLPCTENKFLAIKFTHYTRHARNHVCNKPARYTCTHHLWTNATLFHAQVAQKIRKWSCESLFFLVHGILNATGTCYSRWRALASDAISKRTRCIKGKTAINYNCNDKYASSSFYNIEGLTDNTHNCLRFSLIASTVYRRTCDVYTKLAALLSSNYALLWLMKMIINNSRKSIVSFVAFSKSIIIPVTQSISPLHKAAIHSACSEVLINLWSHLTRCSLETISIFFKAKFYGPSLQVKINSFFLWQNNANINMITSPLREALNIGVKYSYAGSDLGTHLF